MPRRLEKPRTIEERRAINAARMREQYNNDPEIRKRRIESCRQWVQKNPEKAKRYQRVKKLRRYGVTIEWYNEMVRLQGGACAICKDTEHKLVVDHDHKTGRIRGLLCDSCNMILGKLERKGASLLDIYLYFDRSIVEHKERSLIRD